jgi:hypothetical protein
MRKQGSGRGEGGPLTARARAGDERALNPGVSLGMFGKLPGVHRVSPGHYSVTGPFAKISPFVRYEFGLATAPRTMCSPRPRRSVITTSR